jgi:hypothetical protein
MKIALTILAASLALAPAASAQIPQPQPAPPPPPPQPAPPPPPPAPAPAPAAAKIAVRLGSGISDHGRVYVIKGEKLVVRGRLKPFVAGQKVRVELRRKGKVLGHSTRTVHKSGDAGQFQVTLRPRRSGTFTVVAIHKATAEQAAAKSGGVGLTSLVPTAHEGSSGPKVRLLQHALARLAFVTPRGGHYDAATGRAVLAFRKTN